MTVQFEKKVVGNLVMEGIPEIPSEIDRKLNHYENTREAVVVDWLQDGSGMLISTRFGESNQIHLVDHPSGFRKQLTFFNEPVFSASIRPGLTKKGFVFAKDTGGNEVYQLFYFDLVSNSYRLLTDGHSRHGNGIWSTKGDRLIYTSTKRNQKDYDLYVCRPDEPNSEKLLLEGNGLWYPVEWSPDDRLLTLLNFRSINDCPLFILDVETGQLDKVSTNEQVACRGGKWDQNGKGIYFTSDEEGQFRQLYYFEPQSKALKKITRCIEWDVEYISLSPKGDQLAFTVNQGGIAKLHLLNTDDFTFRVVDKVPDGQIGGVKWHPDNNSLAITLNTATSPSDIFVINVSTGETRQWTFSEAGGLETTTFISPSLIHYPTFDNSGVGVREIPAFYFLPKKKTEPPYPVLIYIHGGPESQFRPSFTPIFQYYLNELKVAIIAPNVRGSTGYGKGYLKLDNGFKREDSVRDIGKLLDWIEEQPELDSSRVAVMGGSYGGYMVLASMTHFNERLRCGIDIVGISNFVTFLKNTKSYRRDLRRVEYGDERDPKMRRHLEQISPTTNAHKITKPMLIVQGLNDPRVPVTEAEQMLSAIRQNGGVAWYLLAKDEGHGFRKKSNRKFHNKAVILFLEKYLVNRR